MARPRIPIDVEVVERLARLGLSEVQICNALSISDDTLRRRKKDTEELREALLRGRARGVQEVADALLQQAKKGDVRAQIFFLKARGGWSEPERRPHYIDPHKGDGRERGVPGVIMY
jgi:hypothetical protein